MSKRFIIIITIIIAVVSGVVIYKYSQSSPPTASTQTPDLAHPAHPLRAGTHLYDVRTPEEYATSHAEFAALWPLADLEAGKFPDVHKNEPIAIYCRSGNRSAQAAELLKKAGFTDVIDMGGLSTLGDYGLRLVTN